MEESFGEYFKKLRKKAMLSKWALYQKSNVSYSMIGNIENNQVENISPIVLKKLAKHLNVSYSTLMIKKGYITKKDLIVIVDQKDGLMIGETSQAVHKLLQEKEIIDILDKISRLNDIERQRIIKMLNAF